jgi:cytochrome c556
VATHLKTGLAWIGAGALILGAVATTDAQRRGGRDNSAQGQPVATNTVIENPEPYYGKLVTISAGVDEMLSKTAFVVDQRKMVGTTKVVPAGQPMLVIAPYLSASFDQNQYLMLRGQIVKYDSAAVAKAAGVAVDLAPEIAAKYQGKPVLVASSVVNSVSLELNRKPMMAEEIALTPEMKTISASFTALRAAVQEGKAAIVAEHTAKLAPAFKKTENIWDGLGQSPAAQLARDAQSYAAAIEQAAAAGNWDAVKKSADAMNTTCGSCHGTYRERQDDGVFRFKAGSF